MVPLCLHLAMGVVKMVDNYLIVSIINGYSF